MKYVEAVTVMKHGDKKKYIHAVTTISMACVCESKVCCFNSLQYLQLEKSIIWIKYIHKNVKS